MCARAYSLITGSARSQTRSRSSRTRCYQKYRQNATTWCDKNKGMLLHVVIASLRAIIMHAITCRLHALRIGKIDDCVIGRRCLPARIVIKSCQGVTRLSPRRSSIIIFARANGRRFKHHCYRNELTQVI